MEGTVSSLTDLRIFAKQQLDCLSVGSVPPGLVQYRSPKPKILIKNVVVDATLGTTSKSGCELRDKSFGKSPFASKAALGDFRGNYCDVEYPRASNVSTSFIMEKGNEPLMTASGVSNSEIDALRLRIESVEAERSAFFQEGVFDLIKNIIKDSGVNRTCEIERLKEQVAQLQHMVDERDEQLRRIRERVSGNLDDDIR